MHRVLIAGIALMAGLATAPIAQAQEPVLLHAAGSLRAALTEAARPSRRRASSR